MWGKVVNSAILQSENIYFTWSGNFVRESLSNVQPLGKNAAGSVSLEPTGNAQKKATSDPDCIWNMMPKWAYNTLSSIPSASAASFVSPASYTCAYCYHSYTLNSGSYFVFCARKRKALRYAVVRSVHQHQNVISLFFPKLSVVRSTLLFLCSVKRVWNHFFIISSVARALVSLLLCQKYLNNWIFSCYHRFCWIR